MFRVAVHDPQFIAGANFLGVPVSGAAGQHWTYAFTTTTEGTQHTEIVRRRFRHVVALEERLRVTCPGVVLPPRPEKHVARPLEDASFQQSREFAASRAMELEVYLWSLANHPITSAAEPLRTFLFNRSRDLGAVWPECSTNPVSNIMAQFSQLSQRGGLGASAKATAVDVAGAGGHTLGLRWEDDPNMLGMAQSEYSRLEALGQNVPKLENALVVLREHSQSCCLLGMELSKLVRDTQHQENEDTIAPLRTLANYVLRSGRRSKDNTVSISVALSPFFYQLSVSKNIRAALADRQEACRHREQMRSRAEANGHRLGAQRLVMQQMGKFQELSQLEMGSSAAMGEATEAAIVADQIRNVLHAEVGRLADARRREFAAAMREVAISMRDLAREQRGLWEAALGDFGVVPQRGDSGHRAPFSGQNFGRDIM